MCMQDIQIGRELAPGAKQGAFGMIATVPFLGPDPNRVRIIISSDGLNDCAIWPGDMGAGLTTGFMLTAEHPWQVLRVEDWGRFLLGTWFANDGGTGAALTVVTTTLERQ